MTRRLALAALLVVTSLAGCGTDPPSDNNGMTSGNNGDGECTPGTRTCQDERTLATCARSTEGTPRLVTTTCLDSEQCLDGECQEIAVTCSDLCTPPETRCTTTGEVETCADHDNDGCVEFGAARACDAEQLCDPTDGLCKALDCTDSCAEGTTSCEGELLTTCAVGANGCLSYGQGKECPEGQTCEGEMCVESTTCDDECTVGEFTCTGEGQIRECRTDVDADACAELSAAADCPSGQTCRAGECVPENACQDQCIAGETVCLGNDISTCETQADGCLAFPTAPTMCPAGQACQNTNGTAACATVVVTGPVVINEIFYDAVGVDRRADGTSPTFIELYGPPSRPIGNFTIELVNGSGGTTYGSYTLPPDASLDGNGYAVIATEDADNFLGLALPFSTNVYFALGQGSGDNDIIQNGADNVRLLDDSSAVIDALGYGSFTGSLVFEGEGTAAPDVASGHSLGRKKDGVDTNDNSADFVSQVPTPGFENADLVINEIYFDQPGSDDGAETFVELVNPAIQGWEDLPLDGYVLRAVNGLNGDDYILSGVLPGIDMSGYMMNEGPTDGYIVICNIDTASNALLSLCTVPYEGVDFQNGPDNFVLEYNGRVIDSIGYGSFSGTDVFAGEGTARSFSSSSAGKSLARWKWSDISRDLDTDDNSADFFIVDPTPAAENPLP